MAQPSVATLDPVLPHASSPRAPSNLTAPSGSAGRQPVLSADPTHPQTSVAGTADNTARNAERLWAARPLRERLAILTGARHRAAEQTQRLTDAISSMLARNPADTLAAEVLPLLAACRFLEREAARILRPRHLGRSGRPLWLPGVTHRVERVPLGRVLLLAPGNYPLLLPGVQALQALAAGNGVIWKPGQDGAAVAHVFAHLLFEAGLPRELLQITDESVAAAEGAMASGVDAIFLTGSATTARKVLARAAETLTPVIAELSGCDAVVVLPGANLALVAKALGFGMRLNGSATCMAPRRILFVTTGQPAADTARRQHFIEQLLPALAHVGPVRLPAAVAAQFRALVADAERRGATVAGPGAGSLADPAADLSPVLLLDGQLEMEAARTDLFAPLLTLIEVSGDSGVLTAEAKSPFALTCSIFGPERHARALAAELRCGTVLINDLIVPTADPRVPFGGRRGSGFGVTRGAEGLLAMTAVRVRSTRRGGGTRHLEPTTNEHQSLFRAVVRLGYAGSWQSRFAGAREAARAARSLGRKI